MWLVSWLVRSTPNSSPDSSTTLHVDSTVPPNSPANLGRTPRSGTLPAAWRHRGRATPRPLRCRRPGRPPAPPPPAPRLEEAGGMEAATLTPLSLWFQASSLLRIFLIIPIVRQFSFLGRLRRIPPTPPRTVITSSSSSDILDFCLELWNRQYSFCFFFKLHKYHRSSGHLSRLVANV